MVQKIKVKIALIHTDKVKVALIHSLDADSCDTFKMNLGLIHK